MHRAFSFPVTVERSRTKERLEASLVGLCELELRKQRQESLVLGALALGDPEAACFGSWGQESLTLRRQLVRSSRLSERPSAPLRAFYGHQSWPTPFVESLFGYELRFMAAGTRGRGGAGAAGDTGRLFNGPLFPLQALL